MSIKYIIHPDYQHLENNLLDIKEYFKKSDQSIHKARNELRIADIGGIKTVIKAFKIPHLLNRFIYAYFRDSKAAKSYNNAIKLQALGVSTPLPVGYIEFYENTLFTQSYYITLFEAYDHTIREALHRKVDDYKSVLKAFTIFTYELHQKGIWHVDYSPGNILVTHTDSGYRFGLVDINRMEFRSISPEEGTRAFSKLWAKEDDLLLMAQTYAEVSGLELETAYALMKQHASVVVRNKTVKNRLKGKQI